MSKTLTVPQASAPSVKIYSSDQEKERSLCYALFFMVIKAKGREKCVGKEMAQNTRIGEL